MQLKFLVTIALATFAVAAPNHVPAHFGGGIGHGAGNSMCCNQYVQNSHPYFGIFDTLLGGILGHAGGGIGFGCTVGFDISLL
jgi:hypothetical protein